MMNKDDVMRAWGTFLAHKEDELVSWVEEFLDNYSLTDEGQDELTELLTDNLIERFPEAL